MFGENSRFCVRETSQIDPSWDGTKALAMWENMLSDRLGTMSMADKQPLSGGGTKDHERHT